MQKIPTLFLRDASNMARVTHDFNPDAAWLLTTPAIATVKRDGSNILVVIKGGVLIDAQKRRNPTREEKASGAEPGYTPMDRNNPADKHLYAAIDATNFAAWPDGEWPCETLGPKIQGGIESNVPMLYPFSWCPERITDAIAVTYENIKEYLANHDIEGIVWHGENGKMCKVKRRDFALLWPVRRQG